MMHEVASPGRMRLRIDLPTEVLVNREVSKVIAEAEDGSFCLLPRHVDFVAALVPGVVCYVEDAPRLASTEGAERFAAVDAGILVKVGANVRICTLDGVLGDDLEVLSTLVADRFMQLDEQDRRIRSALARLEAGALRGFHRMQEGSDG
ncbi:MAG TPA: F0F1 ATP synthase subunit epsilon [Myxococcales bacterium LLY-WYZ-16_1]|nr:F0F1 ATP synthase subunit epsilon [Myxococcales bacterium LLY-WYZ-16_1]